MNIMRRRRWLPITVLGLMLAAQLGCQTWIPTAGVTLPSGAYLDHPPQYIPQSPWFTLPREEATMEAISARPAGAAAPPPALPGAGGR